MRYGLDQDASMLSRNHWARLREPEPRSAAFDCDDNGGYWHPAPVRWLPLALACLLLLVAAAVIVFVVDELTH